jgi:hypothetical protein
MLLRKTLASSEGWLTLIQRFPCSNASLSASYATQQALHGARPGAPEPALDIANAPRPLSEDPEVKQARFRQPLREPLHNSLSEGNYGYDYAAWTPRQHRVARSSVSEPDYLLGNSMSDGNYELPQSLRATPQTLRRGQVRNPTMQDRSFIGVRS